MFGDDEVERNIPCPCVDVGNLLKCVRQPDEQGTGAARTQSERERRVVVAGAVPETNTPSVERDERDQHNVEAMGGNTPGGGQGFVDAEAARS